MLTATRAIMRGKLGKLPAPRLRLTLPQSVSVILEIREPQHDLSCFASHVRYNRTLDKGVASPPVVSPGAGVFPNPVHPRAKALPLVPPGVPPGPDQGAFAPPWTHDQEYPSWTWTSSLLDRSGG